MPLYMRGFHVWLRAPKRLLGLFLVLLLLPSVAVVWLGVRWIEQDRQLESSQRKELRSSDADLVVSDLERTLVTVERHLAQSPVDIPIRPEDDAALVSIRGNLVDVTPPNHIYYVPLLDTAPDSAPALANAEVLELKRRDDGQAAAAYRAMARSATGDVQAGALMGLARVLRRMNRPEEALAVYRQLAALPSARTAGLPADLVARRAEAALYADLTRLEPLATSAVALQRDLTNGRWRLSRGTFDAYLSQVDGWLGTVTMLDRSRESLSDALDWLWRQRTRDSFAAGGRSLLHLHDLDVTIVWTVVGDRVVALLAGPAFVDREWVGPIATVLQSRRVTVQLSAPGPQPATPTGSASQGQVIHRPAQQTGLPWTVSVLDGSDSAVAAARLSQRRTLVAGLALLLIVVAAGAFVTVRAVTRELAVARLQSDFVSAVSHEFRTPLTALHQFNALLDDADEPSPEKRRLFYKAQARSAGRLSRLVESLLEFGRMEAGVRPYRMHPVSPVALVRETIGEFSSDPSAEGYVVELSLDDAPATATVFADAEALSRAIRNLLENAVKYSGDSRHIVVKVRRESGMLAIAVHDEGIGIPHSEQRRIFEKFVRGSASRLHGIRGTGLGLAMVRHIVQAHGGRITVESAPSRGSTFTITLPLETVRTAGEGADDPRLRAASGENA